MLNSRIARIGERGKYRKKTTLQSNAIHSNRDLLRTIKKVSKVNKLVKSIVHDSKRNAQDKVTCQLVITIVDKYTQFIVKEKKT